MCAFDDEAFGWALAESLAFAVPMHLAEVRLLPFRSRQRIASEAASVVGGQGDTLMYGSSAKFGSGAGEMRRHRLHGSAKTAECGSCEDNGKTRCCMRRFISKCHVCARGQATWSAGEVFNHLARGLAVAACQPGGVTFSGLHWCAFPHPWCPAGTSSRPLCCACPDECGLWESGSDGTCGRDCPWCRNGCRSAEGRMCCAEEAEACAPEPAGGWRG